MKKIRKVLPLVIVIMTLICFFVANNNRKISVNESEKNNYLEGIEAQEQEEKLVNYSDGISISLLDSSGRLISSTDKNKEIDQMYKFSETSGPSRYININDELYMLIEMKDFYNEETNELKIKENIYYSIDMPNYIIPSEEVVIKKDSEETEIKLFNSGKAEAFGGVYEDSNGGYIFKIRFENLENLNKLSATFQFSLKLSNEIYNQVLDLKNLAIDDFNPLQLWVKKPKDPIVTPEPYPYTLTEYISNINSSDNYYLNVILKDKRTSSEQKTKGTFVVNLGEMAGVNFAEDDFFKNIDVYLNGSKMYKSRTGNFTNKFYYNDTVVNFSIKSIDTSVYYYPNSYSQQQYCDLINNSKSAYSCLANAFEFTVSDVNGNEATGINELKLEIKEKKVTAKTAYIMNSTTFNDYTGVTTPLVHQTGYYSYGSSFTLSSRVNNFYYNGDSYTPTKFTHNIDIGRSPSNYIELEVENRIPTVSGYRFDYYTDHKCLYRNTCGPNDPIRLYINGSQVTFEYTGLIFGSTAMGQISGADPQVQKQMKEVMGYDWDRYLSFENSSGGRWYNSHFGIQKSTTMNENGEYYYMVFAYDMFEYARNNDRGRGDYSNYYYTNSYSYNYNRQEGAPKIKLWIFNVANKSVSMQFDYTLTNSTRGVSRPGGGTSIDLKSTVKNNYTSGTYSTGYGHSFERHMNVRGSFIGDDYIQWEVVIDRNEIRYIEDRWYATGFKLNLHNNHTLSGPSIAFDKYKNRVSTPNGMSFYNSTLHYCHYSYQYKGCDPNYDITPFSSFGSNYDSYNIRNFNRFDGVNYDVYYGTQGKLTNYFYNDKLVLTFLTKITNKYRGAEYTLDFEFLAFGGSPTTNTGEGALMLDYSSTGTIYNYNGTQKYKDGETVRDGKTITSWRVEENISPSDYVTYYPSLDLPYNSGANFPAYPNGSYQFFDKTNDPIGKNIHLSKLTAYISTTGGIQASTSFNFDKNELQNLDNEKCANGVCVLVRYPTENCNGSARTISGCLTYNYGSDYMNTLNSLYNGFSVEITGVKSATHYKIVYETETVHTDLRTYVIGEDEALLTDKLYSIENDVYLNDWYDATSYPTQSRYYNSAAYLYDQIKVIADISVDKKIKETTTKEYLTKDTTSNTVTVTIGYSESEYVKLDDIIRGIGSDKENVDTNEKIDIKQLKKYLELNNLKINYYPTLQSTKPTTIYENGEFIDEWSDSTLTIDPNDDKLYSLYLKRNNSIINAESKFEIVYNLVFDIDNNRGIKDDNGNVLGSYRPNDIYKGNGLYVISNIEGVRPYKSSNDISVTPDHDPYVNYIDYENKELHVFNSSDIRSGYLVGPTAEKTGNASSDNSYKYEVVVDFNSAGKSETAAHEFVDILTYELEIPEAEKTDDVLKKKNELDYLLKDYTKIKDAIITSTNKDNSNIDETLIEIKGYLSSGKKEYNKDNIYFSFELKDGIDKNKLEFIARGFKYDTIVNIAYRLEIDYESFFKAAIEKNLLTEELFIYGSEIKYNPELVNSVKTIDEETTLAQYSSGTIRIQEVVPTVNKTAEYPTEDDILWNITANTGYADEEITIKDTFTVEGSNAQIKDAIVLKDLTIKIDDEIVYEESQLKDEWKNNITINGLEFKFKNSEENKFINENRKITITYKTHFDVIKYNELGGQKTGTYSLKNKVNLEKGTIKDNSLVNTKDFEFDYPTEHTKYYIGNPNEDLTRTRWKIEFSSNEIDRKNVIIKDNAVPSSDFGSYLSLNDMIIKTIKDNEENVLFDHSKGINNLPSQIKLTTIDNKELLFNKNGLFNFMLNIELLESNTKIVIEYEYIIDKEKYAYDKQPTDVELLVQNNATINYDDIDAEELSVNGAFAVSSLVAKKFTTLSKTSTNMRIKWDIDLNLNVEYNGTLKEDDEVIVTDELFDGLVYEDNSLQVYNRILDGTNYATSTALEKDIDYTYTYEDNTIKVKLLKPNINSNIRITFNTNSKLLNESIRNFLNVSVNGKSTHISSEEVAGVFLNYIGGTVTSQGITYYTIYANKYFDGELSKQPFNFELIEINYEGEELKDGIKIKGSNNEEGKIALGPIKLDSEGIHYFKIKEIVGNKKINYDQNEYILKMEVVNYQNVYTINEMKLVNTEDEEMNFYNTTKKEEPIESDTSDAIKENPNTSSFIKKIILAIVFIGVSGILVKLLMPKIRIDLD